MWTKLAHHRLQKSHESKFVLLKDIFEEKQIVHENGTLNHALKQTYMYKAITADRPHESVACTVFSVLILSTQENVGKMSFATVLFSKFDRCIGYSTGLQRLLYIFEIIHVSRDLGKYFFTHDLFCY